MFGKKNKNVSLGDKVHIRGYEIRRMPIGAYIEALELIERLPGEMLEECFPGLNLQQIGALMTNNSRDAMQVLLVGLLEKAPNYMLDVLSALLGIDREALEQDAAIGLDGLMEMIEAWLEINGIANFWKAVKLMLGRLGKAARPGMNTTDEASSD